MQEPRDYTVLISTFVTELRKPSIDDDKCGLTPAPLL